jgi:hypothetical protein
MFYICTSNEQNPSEGDLKLVGCSSILDEACQLAPIITASSIATWVHVTDNDLNVLETRRQGDDTPWRELMDGLHEIVAGHQAN